MPKQTDCESNIFYTYSLSADYCFFRVRSNFFKAFASCFRSRFACLRLLFSKCLIALRSDFCFLFSSAVIFFCSFFPAFSIFFCCRMVSFFNRRSARSAVISLFGLPNRRGFTRAIAGASIAPKLSLEEISADIPSSVKVRKKFFCTSVLSKTEEKQAVRKSPQEHKQSWVRSVLQITSNKRIYGFSSGGMLVRPMLDSEEVASR